MEKEAFFGSPAGQNWQLLSNDELCSGYLSLPGDQSIYESAQIESALSSIVSSPSTNPLATAVTGNSVIISELIGRLGGICNSDRNSCHNTSLDSPQKPDISIATNPAIAAAHMPFCIDPGFAGMPMGCSSFVGCSKLLPPEAGELSRASSSQSLKSSGQVGDSNAKGRKAAPRGKRKEVPLSSSVTTATYPHKEDCNSKRSKLVEASGDQKNFNGPKAEPDGHAPSRKPEEKSTEQHESPRDYIHVRARRGQATDSHSLAERVRREKISERMKLLQDLVPGCDKVIGKAVMLDEIINYVQSLQRQVEFLSMKLAIMYPQLDFNMDGFFPKNLQIHQTCGPVCPFEVTSTAFSFVNPARANGLELPSQGIPTGHSSFNLLMPPLQLGAFWEDDLQTVIQMGFTQNQ